MIYSVFVLDQDGILEAAWMASKILTSPEAIIELFGERLNYIRGEVEVGLGEFKVVLIPSNDTFYLIVHDDDPKARDFINELLTIKPKDSQTLYGLLAKYITPRRSDITNLISEVRKNITPKTIEKEKLKEYDVRYIDSIPGFMDEYTEAEYLEARKHDVSASKHPYIKALWVFAARLTRNSPPYEEIPKKELIFRLAAQTPERVRRYFQDLRDAMSDLGLYRQFVERFYNKRDEINDFFSVHKSLYTTTLVPIAGSGKILSTVYKYVPDKRKDAFRARIYSILFFVGAQGKKIRRALEDSYNSVNSYRPFSYAFYLPLAIASSISLSTGKLEVYTNELTQFFSMYGEKPMYSMLSDAILNRSIPVLYDINRSLLEKRYIEIAERIAKRFFSERGTHIYYATSISTLNTLALALQDSSLSGFLSDPIVLSSVRTLYPLSYRGSRSALVMFYRLTNSLALSVLAKDPKNKIAREVLMKSFLIIDRKDYFHNLVVRAAEESVSEDIAELLKTSFELRVFMKDPNRALREPIYQSSTFYFESIEQLEAVMAEGARFPKDKTGKFVYTRGSNPNVRELENSISELEGARDSVVFASGMAAIASTLFTLLRSGSRVILGVPTYGDTYLLFNEFLSRFGIIVQNVPAHKLHEYSGEADFIFVEAVTNPTLRVPIVDEIEGLVIIDNTFTTPLFYRALENAYAVTASLTKFMNGHADSLGGYVASNDEGFIETLRYTLFLTGAAIDPFAARLIRRGLLTLRQRLSYDEHAIRLVEGLLDLGYAAYYPLHPEHPDYEIARRLLKGFTGIVAVDVIDERKAREIVNALASKGIRLAPSFGAPETLVELPRSLSHAFMSAEEKKYQGISPGLVRISLGFKNPEEDVEKIIETFKRF